MWFLRDGLKIPARRYATIASGKTSLRGKKGPPLTLEHVGTFSAVYQGLGMNLLSNHMLLACSFYNEAERWRYGGISFVRPTVGSPLTMWRKKLL